MLNDELHSRILAFRAERDWEKFHNLRTLSTSIVLEAAELAEICQWVSDAELNEVVVKERKHIEQELADIAILMIYLLADLGIDLEQAVEEKLQDNAARYPVEKARGNSLKYDKL